MTDAVSDTVLGDEFKPWPWLDPDMADGLGDVGRSPSRSGRRRGRVKFISVPEAVRPGFWVGADMTDEVEPDVRKA